MKWVLHDRTGRLEILVDYLFQKLYLHDRTGRLETDPLTYCI